MRVAVWSHKHAFDFLLMYKHVILWEQLICHCSLAKEHLLAKYSHTHCPPLLWDGVWYLRISILVWVCLNSGNHSSFASHCWPNCHPEGSRNQCFHYRQVDRRLSAQGWMTECTLMPPSALLCFMCTIPRIQVHSVTMRVRVRSHMSAQEYTWVMRVNWDAWKCTWKWKCMSKKTAVATFLKNVISVGTIC